jgi:hypothetical protein
MTNQDEVLGYDANSRPITRQDFELAKQFVGQVRLIGGQELKRIDAVVADGKLSTELGKLVSPATTRERSA